MRDQKLFFIVFLILQITNFSSAQVVGLKCKNFKKELATLSFPRKLKNKSDSLNFLNCIEKSISDTISENRFNNLIKITSQYEGRYTDELTDRALVKIYIRLINSKSSFIGISAINNIKKIDRKLFDSSAIRQIANAINDSSLYLKDILLLAGYLNDTVLSQKIRYIAINRKLSGAEYWAMKLSLARMGDRDAIESIKNKLNTVPLSSKVVESIYPDLIYTKQKLLYDIMVEKLFVDEELCESSNPDSDNMIVCGYRITELLAPNINDFPINVLPSGDLDTDNYSKALLIARDWFIKNQMQYSINYKSY
jgi:hypothetical protein